MEHVGDKARVVSAQNKRVSPCHQQLVNEAEEEAEILQRGQVVSKLKTGERSSPAYGAEVVKVAKVVNERYQNELGESMSATEDELTHDKMMPASSPYACAAAEKGFKLDSSGVRNLFGSVPKTAGASTSETPQRSAPQHDDKFVSLARQ